MGRLRESAVRRAANITFICVSPVGSGSQVGFSGRSDWEPFHSQFKLLRQKLVDCSKRAATGFLEGRCSYRASVALA